MQAPNRPEFQNMRQVYLDAMDELAKPYPAIPVNNWGIFTRFTGGFRAREFSIFCGPTGAGKTAWLASLSANLLRQSVKHFVMSVETGRTDFMKRIMSDFANEDLNTGEAVPAAKLAKIHLEHEHHFAKDCIEFALHEDRLPVERLISELEYMVKERGCKVAIIDNLNFFMEVTSSANAVVEMDRVIHALIIFCKKIDVHLIMVMHPKKTDGGRIESEFDIKGSSTAVQEAHNVFLFNRPHPDDVARGNRHFSERDLKIAKLRRRGGFQGRTVVFSSNGARYVEKGYQ